jgi:D-hydroxyproline dehydrogenase subunit beta
VLREFAEQAAHEQRGCEMLASSQVRARFPAIVATGLRGGLFSPTELTIDPRLTIAKLPDWLARDHGVEFAFGTPILSYEKPRIISSQGEFRADRLFVCTGADFREIAPDAFASCGFLACKLQMMRSQAFGTAFRLGTLLAAGLTLRHYKAFAQCPTLPELEKRLLAQYPEHARLGIHVMASQNGVGEIAIGDSHEYGDAIDPFDKPAIDELILDYLRTFVAIPDLRIASRWHGIYVKHPTKPYVIAKPSPGLTAIAGGGGMGMTLSFGLAERVVAQELGERT